METSELELILKKYFKGKIVNTKAFPEVIKAMKEAYELGLNERDKDSKDWTPISKETEIDGQYLCYVKQVLESGNILYYQRVVTNSINLWSLRYNEVILFYQPLPKVPNL